MGGDYLGCDWEIPSLPVWEEIFRVLKPGGYVLAFGGTRTFDLISMGLRFAGFENRDTICEFSTLQWVYSGGFPKGHRIKDPVSGSESCIGLKPSWEPISVFRKPVVGSLKENIAKHGTGAILLDKTKASLGRLPTNVLLSHTSDCVETESGWSCSQGCPALELDSQSGHCPSTLTGRAEATEQHTNPSKIRSKSTFTSSKHTSHVYADDGGASRFYNNLAGPFFFEKKANRVLTDLGGMKIKHPTMKPLNLMRHLVNLVTPPGGIVLDPYCGSGTTCHAAAVEGFDFVGVEKYLESHAEASERLSRVMRVKQEDRLNEDIFFL
jgi:site-specific DNA-methyltransferase (adenine-specific)